MSVQADICGQDLGEGSVRTGYQSSIGESRFPGLGAKSVLAGFGVHINQNSRLKG